MLMTPACLKWHRCWSRKHFQFEVLPSSDKTAALQHPHFSLCRRPSPKLDSFHLHLLLWFAKAACSSRASVAPETTRWKAATKTEWKRFGLELGKPRVDILCLRFEQSSHKSHQHEIFVCIVRCTCTEVLALLATDTVLPGHTVHHVIKLNVIF